MQLWQPNNLFLQGSRHGKTQVVSALVRLWPFCSIKCDDVKVLYVPQYENLSIERLLETARKNPQVPYYLPDDRDMHKVPRQWLINVAYTIIGKPFSDWVKEEIVLRNEEIAKK